MGYILADFFSQTHLATLSTFFRTNLAFDRTFALLDLPADRHRKGKNGLKVNSRVHMYIRSAFGQQFKRNSLQPVFQVIFPLKCFHWSDVHS
jgi:hypothetical protein